MEDRQMDRDVSNCIGRSTMDLWKQIKYCFLSKPANCRQFESYGPYVVVPAAVSSFGGFGDLYHMLSSHKEKETAWKNKPEIT